MIETLYETELIPVAVNVPTAVQKRRDDLIADGRCIACEEKLVPDKNGKINVRRGQCVACYSATRRNLDKRRVTKSELVREGKLLTPTKGGRKPRNEFTKQLARR